MSVTTTYSEKHEEIIENLDRTIELLTQIIGEKRMWGSEGVDRSKLARNLTTLLEVRGDLE
ncbi:hypothetical protein [Burkholderia phage BCSR5]|nr:hypothetical protein [Burkholderia phage BCSR5]